MAGVSEQRSADALLALLNAYGVAVRAGVITPNIDDEIAIRALMELPPVNDAVRANWERNAGVKAPVTVQADKPPAAEPAQGE